MDAMEFRISLYNLTSLWPYPNNSTLLHKPCDFAVMHPLLILHPSDAPWSHTWVPLPHSLGPSKKLARFKSALGSLGEWPNSSSTKFFWYPWHARAINHKLDPMLLNPPHGSNPPPLLMSPSLTRGTFYTRHVATSKVQLHWSKCSKIDDTCHHLWTSRGHISYFHLELHSWHMASLSLTWHPFLSWLELNIPDLIFFLVHSEISSTFTHQNLMRQFDCASDIDLLFWLDGYKYFPIGT